MSLSGRNEGERPFLEGLQKAIRWNFSDPSLLERAMTHRSYVHEQTHPTAKHNELMEFLGDSILGFIISEELYRRYPSAHEGSLSKGKAYLVSASNLYPLALRLGIGRYLRLSFGEEKTGGRNKRALLVNSYEALIAAIYLDGGIEVAREFIQNEFRQDLEKIDVERVRYFDYKSTLQEHLHHLHLPDPLYQVLEEAGPDHQKTFLVQLSVKTSVTTQASGRTKKEAQQNAARIALQRLRSKESPGERG